MTFKRLQDFVMPLAAMAIASQVLKSTQAARGNPRCTRCGEPPNFGFCRKGAKPYDTCTYNPTTKKAS